MPKPRTILNREQQTALLATLHLRFEANSNRHPGLAWGMIAEMLLNNEQALAALFQMESTQGEPDVVSHDPLGEGVVFYDCCAESPAGRRNLCYDQNALVSRKQNKPRGSAMEMARNMGVEMLTEGQYRHLQTLGEFDAKTSSWVVTPPGIRHLGGALFCDRRYDHVFVYHNGAESYYAARGFRSALRLQR